MDKQRDWLFTAWTLFWIVVIAGVMVALAACR